MGLKTTVLKVNPEAPEEEYIRRAADLLREGELVAFPTETVYGLGANALDSTAVARTFRAKGRPATNPLIVHVLDSEAARAVTAEWPAIANTLTAQFWPGPLTLILRKSRSIPSIVTAGGDTVAVRSPDHPIAHALLRTTSFPLTAPSANRSTKISPTRAEHVHKSLGGRIPLILDGGPCPRGLESTVLDLTSHDPRILRPGPVTAAMLAPTIGRVEYHETAESGSTLKSPGLIGRHYAPNARVAITQSANAEAVRLASSQLRVGLLSLEGSDETLQITNLKRIQMPNDPLRYAGVLYDVLHELEDWSADVIVISAVPITDEWRAIADRLERASRGNSA